MHPNAGAQSNPIKAIIVQINYDGEEYTSKEISSYQETVSRISTILAGLNDTFAFNDTNGNDILIPCEILRKSIIKIRHIKNK